MFHERMRKNLKSIKSSVDNIWWWQELQVFLWVGWRTFKTHLHTSFSLYIAIFMASVLYPWLQKSRKANCSVVCTATFTRTSPLFKTWCIYFFLSTYGFANIVFVICPFVVKQLHVNKQGNNRGTAVERRPRRLVVDVSPFGE